MCSPHSTDRPRNLTPTHASSRAYRHPDGEFNVLVSTSVSKEGIDVGSCRIGLEHGKLKTATELTQFMGRVRAEDGRYTQGYSQLNRFVIRFQN